MSRWVWIFLLLVYSQAVDCQRCKAYSSIYEPANNSDQIYKFQFREALQCRLVFHVFYSTPEEKLSSLQIYSQMEVLNRYFHETVNSEDFNIPEPFRSLKANPNIQFCLADTTPAGEQTIGIEWIAINDLSIACKSEFGKRNLMHKNLGGVDVWDPKTYINIFVINRNQCPVLGEAIYPWDATLDEDGIFIDYRSVGAIGSAYGNKPFHQGKTLVHEMGHYFGLLHLSGDKSECTGDDGVSDTPVQDLEYYGCPKFPQIRCGQSSQYMNFMSLVDDACMHMFTKGQVNRMNEQIQLYRPEIGNMNCAVGSQSGLEQIFIRQDQMDWQLLTKNHKLFNSNLELYDMNGRLRWKQQVKAALSISLSAEILGVNPGVYFLLVSNKEEKLCYKLILVR